MRKITGDIDIRLPLSEVNRINELIERDTAKAIRQDEKYESLTYCPTCKAFIMDSYLFCSKCGQRLDQSNKEF